MSFLTPQAELDYRDSQRKREVSYYVGNPEKNLRGHLYDFCVDILGYDALSETFHKPMLDEWDRMDLHRFRCHLGLEEPSPDKPRDNMDLWFRGAIKTWCTRARVIRYYLWDPGVTVTWWHAVEEKAVESADAIAEQLQLNTKLRALFPAGILPAMNRKKFCAGGKFNLKGKKIGTTASMQALGAGGEGTGGHSLVVVLDDFIGYNDVVDAQMPKKKEFYRATVCNVCLRIIITDPVTKKTREVTGWKDVIGTHWAIDDPYVDWRKSPDWICRVRACVEDGKPVYLSQDQIDKELREQGPTMFAFQMMNDPSPSGAKPWSVKECEKPTITLEDAKGPGWVVVLGDPAPRAMGSVGGRDEKFRKDGTKNFWANVAVKLRRKGDLRQIILLDAQQSRDWGLDEGMKNLAQMALKWRANEGYCEHTSTPIYLERFMEAKRELGWKGYVIGSRKLTMGDSEDRLKQTYNANAKNAYLVALCDRAKMDEFLVCDKVPADLRLEFLSQMRGFMPLPDGRTGIPFDDLANAVAFATDPYFRSRYPMVAEPDMWSPYRDRDKEPEYMYENRHIQW